MAPSSFDSNPFPSIVAIAALLAMAACGGAPVDPSPTCRSGDLFGTGFGGPIILGFTLDQTTVAAENEIHLRVGERARIRVTVDNPSSSGGCDAQGPFTYMKWSWNFWRDYSNQEEKATPQLGPIDVTVATCNCRLFGEPYWNSAPLGGAPNWDQRAWLESEQTVEFDVRATAVGRTSFFIIGFTGRPFTTSNPVEDFVRYSLIPLYVRVTS